MLHQFQHFSLLVSCRRDVLILSHKAYYQNSKRDLDNRGIINIAFIGITSLITRNSIIDPTILIALIAFLLWAYLEISTTIVLKLIDVNILMRVDYKEGLSIVQVLPSI